MDIKPIKKSKKLILRQMKQIEEAEDLVQAFDAGRADVFEPVIEEKAVVIQQSVEPGYISIPDNPIVRSVGNYGWQPSDIGLIFEF